jgi:hypothetical protein
MRRLVLLIAACCLTALVTQAQLLSGPIPYRRVGINEGFTQQVIAGQLTPTTVDQIVARGFRAVKIWPESLGPANLTSVFRNPSIDVIVYRPLHQAQVTSSPCGTTYWDENVDYGTIANQLYSYYSDQPKVVILTGWEADNQIQVYGSQPPDCDLSDWVSPQRESDFRTLLINRQRGVAAARAAHPGTALTVYHAAEVRKVGGVNTVLNKIISTLGTDKPDLISYSAWSSPSAQLPGALDTIAGSSGLSHDRIFVGEWGCAAGTSKATRDSCYQSHSDAAFNWGVRLWIVWTYAGADQWRLVETSLAPSTPDPFPELTSINSFWSSLK